MTTVLDQPPVQLSLLDATISLEGTPVIPSFRDAKLVWDEGNQTYFVPKGDQPVDPTLAAIEKADEHADAEWKVEAIKIVEDLARRKMFFNADDFWMVMDKTGFKTHDKRAFGNIMRQAVKKDLCKKTTTFVKSKRKNCHSMDIPVYESLIYLHPASR